jgi:hypothetical protein
MGKSGFRLLVAAAIASGVGCRPRPAPTLPDTDAPNLNLQVEGRSFNTDEGAGAPMDGCAEVRRFPVQLAVSASDRGGGGIASVVVRVFPGRISDTSVAPATAEVRLVLDRSTHVLTLTPRPDAGTVQPNLLATLEVDRESAVAVSATDTSGNGVELYQVDLWPLQSPVLCRGEAVPD